MVLAMSSDKKTINHKITNSIFFVLVLTYGIIELIKTIFLHLESPFGIFIGGIIFITYAYLISSYVAGLFSYKFISQVNRMTDTAKAIANSKDLKKRVNISEHPDELSNLEEALNSMLTQLENAFERQRRFVSDASHELRTPVSIMKGYLDILDDWGKGDSKLLAESIKSMKEETQHMKKLIENLLFLAKADEGQLQINCEDIQLNTVIEKLIHDTRMIAGSRNVECRINEPLIIKGDQELILQMLRALVENSIKYTNDNGEITINLHKEKKYALIDIIDNGIGISQEDVKRIFDRFYRVEEARSKDSGGSGLGLALVKKIADMHEGKIKIHSKLGEGTKMIIYIPLKTQ